MNAPEFNRIPYFYRRFMAAKIEKYLITGFSGFVSEHFLDHLASLPITAQVLGIDIHKPAFDLKKYPSVQCRFQKADLLNKASLEKLLDTFQPDYVLHLASFSSVAFSWKQPVESFRNNTNIFLNLIETIRELAIPCRIISVGSSEEYGNVKKNDIPLSESQALNPISPYAVARVSQEMLSKVYVDSYGMDIILTRSFNHIGTRQRELFVIPSFARQLIDIKKHTKNKELSTGDTSIVRDFVDVRDVVRAYYLLFKKGKKGEIYNICSGKGHRLSQVIQSMAKLLKLKITQKVDPAKVRPNDNKIIVGSYEKIRKHTGWKPEYSLEKSLADILDYLQNH